MLINEPSIRKKGFKPAKRKCLTCGKLFNSLDPSDRYCPPHKIAKRAANEWYYTEDDFGAMFVSEHRKQISKLPT